MHGDLKLSLIILLIFHLDIGAFLSKDETHQKKFAPCKACRTFIESFKKGMVRTSTGKFEGGDTAWEEEKLGSYATSEIRLIEIQEKVCSDVDEGKDQCYALHEEFDNVLEDWWFKKQSEEPDLFKYFCIETVQSCCPVFHFGTNCTPCHGFPNTICNGNGKCKGAGTRKGNGKCDCDSGYIGEVCDQCDAGFYTSYKDENKFLCSKCHPACEGTCSSGGGTGCSKCNKGWIMDTEKGCLDINECASKENPCTEDEFCVNAEGSFRCLKCDRSCSGCTGDGPDMCVKCANGFYLLDNICIDGEQENRQQHVFLTRYLTYLGLCISTCIIFNKNTILAAIIGVSVAIYITLSEYVLNSHENPKTGNIFQQMMGYSTEV